MYNFLYSIQSRPEHFRQLSFGESLFTEFNCPLENKYQEGWSHLNYIVYVLKGKKVWHTLEGSHELTENTCVFVRKGGSIVEQFFDSPFCVLMFFITDEFICEVLRPRLGTFKQPAPVAMSSPPIIPIETDATLTGFFPSMLPYFATLRQPDTSLLELKFKELLLNVVANPRNQELLRYFSSLLDEPASATLRKIMDSNFCYNLSLEEFAQLCNRSLSAFKRDFNKIYGIPPGKWLHARRLEHARLLLARRDKRVSDVAFESGFENLSHFSRAFRQYFGTSPALFRQQLSV